MNHTRKVLKTGFMGVGNRIFGHFGAGGGSKNPPNPQEALIYQYVTYIYHFQTFFIKKKQKKTYSQL